MKLKVLAKGEYEIVAVMDGDACPAEAFLTEGPSDTDATRAGLVAMLEQVAQSGFHGVPGKWCHEANKKEQVYEFACHEGNYSFGNMLAGQRAAEDKRSGK